MKNLDILADTKQAESVLYNVLKNHPLFAESDNYWVIIAAYSNGECYVLTDDNNYLVKYTNKETANKVLESLNNSELAHYYLQQIKL